jgi:acyl dehydratase
VETRQHYGVRDTILYALGLGLGAGDGATDMAALRYLYEKDLAALPTMATMLAYPSGWWADPVFGLDRTGVVNAGQWLQLHAPLPIAASVVSRLRVEAIEDKGVGRGALIHSVREINDETTGALLATTRQAIFCRSEGGFGGDPPPVPLDRALPTSAPDMMIAMPTREEAALLFRLSGDYNPLHVDPLVARAAGFARPILHGLAIFGMAGYALARAGMKGCRLITARFSAPVLPGDTLRCDIWQTSGGYAFQMIEPASNRVALDRGWAQGA